MNQSLDSFDEMTLDPPGRIVIIGGGPLGLEAALYGRFLGYEVVLFEKGEIGQSMLANADEPLPMLPDRCLSPLAISALKAQDGGLVFPGTPTFPTTIGQWIANGLVRVASTDLLIDRVTCHCEVTAIGLVAEDADSSSMPNNDAESDSDETYIDGEVPLDFQLMLREVNGTRFVEAEAVIFAIGAGAIGAASISAASISAASIGAGAIGSVLGYQDIIDSPYRFRIGECATGSAEENLHRGWREIVSIYARLGGRKTLDLYRPFRS